MKRTDAGICLDALWRARVALSTDINPVNTFEAAGALDQIVDFIDSEEVDAALSRIKARDHFTVMEFRYREAPR
ncbi:hypothetical protein [Bradyrhizobium arachidis]|uniref:hypothetical protein n=1 Tax=Bradyrhizobium arachidis TaxID=858423 RepID=UPI0008EF1F9A|nr:hypothetical protein [Bradyrhizobium arachidis]SFV11797.1 hypothetical protein SAMN05192541_117145 [Bradyrhizobium arachidis]